MSNMVATDHVGYLSFLIKSLVSYPYWPHFKCWITQRWQVAVVIGRYRTFLSPQKILLELVQRGAGTSYKYENCGCFQSNKAKQHNFTVFKAFRLIFRFLITIKQVIYLHFTCKEVMNITGIKRVALQGHQNILEVQFVVQFFILKQVVVIQQ